VVCQLTVLSLDRQFGSGIKESDAENRLAYGKRSFPVGFESMFKPIQRLGISEKVQRDSHALMREPEVSITLTEKEGNLRGPLPFVTDESRGGRHTGGRYCQDEAEYQYSRSEFSHPAPSRLS
jgi:hypothetical protein